MKELFHHSLNASRGHPPATKRTLPLLFVPLLLLILGCTFLTRLAGDQPGAAYGVDREEALFLSGGQPRTLDPALTHGGPSGALGHIFSGLVTLGPDLRVHPDLAAGWEVRDGGTRYIFHLHPNARFHDGRPVTAEDVIFSWERAADPQMGSDTALTYLGDIVGVAEKVAGEADRIVGLRALDEHTLEVRIDGPKPAFLAKLTYPVAFVVDHENVRQPDWEHQPNGSGPFKLAVWEDDEIIVLARNEAFYGPRANIPHVVLLLDAGLPLARYENGEIDIVGVGGATLERVEDPNDPLFAELRRTAAMCTTFVGLNNERPPLDDPLVRQALSHALDRERLISGLMQGNALPANGPLPPGIPGYTERTAPYPFDPQKARSLLLEASYDPDTSPPLTFTTAGYGSVGSFVAAVISMWEENLGITIEPVLLDPFSYSEQLHDGNVGHFYSYGWCADYPDPQNFLDVLYHSSSPQNLGQFDDPVIDRLLEEARVEPDPQARLGLYGEIEAALIEAAPAVYVSHSLAATLVKPYIESYHLTPIGVPQWHRLRIER